jgi:hypothetical protein
VLTHAALVPKETPVTTNQPACRDVDDPDMFFDDMLFAKRICAGCQLKAPCLDAAMRLEGSSPTKYRHGVWGGTLPDDRARLLRAARVAA